MTADHDPQADHVFDGGSMDCGSGLILLIRQNMLQVPAGGLLEIRSSEPTVAAELPPWCRMVGHKYVRTDETGPGQWRHFVRRSSDSDAEEAELNSDKQKAQDFKWSVRARRTASNETTIYARNFSWKSGPSISFDKTGSSPTALEQFFGSLLADVVSGFSTRCSQLQVLIDDLEGTTHATLNSSLAAVGLENGDSSVKKISIVLYVTSPAAGAELQKIWDDCLSASPIFQTLSKACEIDSRIVLL